MGTLKQIKEYILQLFRVLRNPIHMIIACGLVIAYVICKCYIIVVTQAKVCGPRALGVHIRQSTCACVTTI